MKNMIRGEETYIRQIEGQWYAFGAYSYDNGGAYDQVCAIGEDAPESGYWVANWTDNGIKSVSHGSSRDAAYKRAKRHGEYCGIG